jgi:polysaccharide deacetylase family protein (PEP-CTERM system associated)
MNCRSIISVDVEDYFQVEAFAGVIDRSQWNDYACRVERNTERILDLLDDSQTKATFFILGWVAERFPQLVRQIAERGHEPACHSYWHRLIYTLTPAEFREDTLRAKNAIEQATGAEIHGYRAPSFSITKRSLWALDILAELGFRYDSSVFPVKHDVYGFPQAPRRPFRVETPAGPIVEFPMATFHLGAGPNLPVAGGGYLRMLPLWYTKGGVKRAWREGLPVVSYVHPWEFDPEQPRFNNAPLKSRLRHYTNLNQMEMRLRGLLALDSFSSFRDSGLVASAAPLSLQETIKESTPR